MKLSDLQEKDVISIKDGRKIGKIVDADINSENGEINYLIVEPKRGFKNIISSGKGTNISFANITKIGEDVILVDF